MTRTPVDTVIAIQKAESLSDAVRIYQQALLTAEKRRDEQWRQQLSGRMLHETFREVASGLYNHDWQGTPFEELDEKSVRQYNAVAVEVAKNIKEALTNLTKE
jgi:hypothetical protein